MLHDLLRTLPPDKKGMWPHFLPQLLFAYNTTVHQSTQHSSYELMFGQKPHLQIDFLLGVAGEELVGGGVSGWILHHKEHLSLVNDSAWIYLGMGPSKCLHRYELKLVPTSHVSRAPVAEEGVESGEEEIEAEEGDGFVVEVTVSHPSALSQISEGQIERGIQLHPYPLILRASRLHWGD